ncbi:MAG: lysophospholipid acyltransferase family protein [Thermomicrobiales bacterium]
MTNPVDPRDGGKLIPHPRSALPRIAFGTSERGDSIYYAAVILASLASWLTALLPHGLLSRIARLVGWISVRRTSVYKANIQANFSHVTDQPADSQLVQDLVRTAFTTNALNVIDLLEIPHLKRREFERRIKVTSGSLAVLDSAMDSGRGAIIITAHLGPFDFVASYLRVLGYPLSALTARTTGRFAFHFTTFLRGSQNMRVIETSSGGLRQALRLLQQGEMLILLSDRDFFLSGRETRFFGETTTLPVGAIRLARDTGVPIIPYFAYREHDHYQLALGKPVTIARTDNRSADIAAGVAQLSKVLEAAISRKPGQWVLFQRVWPDKSAADDQSQG